LVRPKNLKNANSLSTFQYDDGDRLRPQANCAPLVVRSNNSIAAILRPHPATRRVRACSSSSGSQIQQHFGNGTGANISIHNLMRGLPGLLHRGFHPSRQESLAGACQ
jgi:hypothetical protein